MSLFQRLLGRLRQPRPEQSAEPAPAVQGAPDREGFPPTFVPPLATEERIDDLVFDPSLKQFSRAFRRGDPKLSPAEMDRWHAARRQVMRHLLVLSTSSEWGGHLVLRGSLALKAWFGSDAREPGDIDWVIRPPDLRMDEPQSQCMLKAIIQAAAADPACPDARIESEAITRTDIWTYDRAPGHRLAFPWRCGDLPAGLVQMDFVFQQRLHTPVQEYEIQLGEGQSVTVSMASAEESLAWKLLWLHSDQHPQGKDLYDAALLAERCELPGPLLKTVLEEGDCWRKMSRSLGFPFVPDADANVDWENFLKECPWVPGSAEEWSARLIEAIKPATAHLRELMRQA